MFCNKKNKEKGILNNEKNVNNDNSFGKRYKSVKDIPQFLFFKALG